MTASPRTILFVCTGNICRSPMAEALMRRRLKREGRDGDYCARSAGIWGLNGRGPTRESVIAMAQRGIDIRSHRARTLTQLEVDRADLILVMARAHADAIRKHFARWEDKLLMLNQTIGRNDDIEDPYGMPMHAYLTAAERLEHAIDDGFDYILAALEGAGRHQ